MNNRITQYLHDDADDGRASPVPADVADAVDYITSPLDDLLSPENVAACQQMAAVVERLHTTLVSACEAARNIHA